MDQFSVLIKELYKKDADRVLREIADYKKQFDLSHKGLPDTNWYKFMNLYFLYPDSIGGKKGTPLSRIIPHLQHVKDLGCDAVHILPFFESPMIDKGFDISDFTKVRANLGTIKDIDAIVKQANMVGLKLFMDLVFNHVSDQHDWFKRAQSGDEKYRNYFIYQKNKPEFIKKYHKDSAVWADFVVNNKVQSVNIAFPDRTGEIPMWREGKDGYWYYHTYYPEQLDMNWRNPDVFIEFAKIIITWGAKGFNFRFDAIPFVGKGAYKDVDDRPRFARTLLASFTKLIEDVNPESVCIVETYEKTKTTIDYFGDPNYPQAKLGYNFHLCTYMWLSFVKRDAGFLWEKLDQLKQIPVHADWINFLRNHDELSLAYLSDDLLSVVKRQLMRRGAPFREGYGISGRTYSLLGNNEKKFLNAYFLLSSLPGGMLIPYGDEFGKKNIPIDKLPEKDRSDTRNINRGILTHKEMKTAKAKRITQRLSDILHSRRHLQEYLNIWPDKVDASQEVFACIYKKGSSRLVVLINLSNKTKRVNFKTGDYRIIEKLFEVDIQSEQVVLPPFAGVWLQK